jgi:hypothetical protein
MLAPPIALLASILDIYVWWKCDSFHRDDWLDFRLWAALAGAAWLLAVAVAYIHLSRRQALKILALDVGALPPRRPGEPSWA